MSEMVANARYIASAVRVPLIADADTDFGNAINVIHTIREYIGAGRGDPHGGPGEPDARGASGGSMDDAIRRANAFLAAARTSRSSRDRPAPRRCSASAAR
jgi:2-methylisocitrate lyase-like PEP mutase family enzyme